MTFIQRRWTRKTRQMIPIGSLWIGQRLGDLELASIRSFQRMGHPFTLYSYDPIENLPDGIELAPAADILPVRQILRHSRDQSPAPHSDLFRYAMISLTGKTWVDMDMIAVRPFAFDTPWVFGFEDAQQVNNAVLCLPKYSMTLRELCTLCTDTRGVPPHIAGARRLKYRLRGIFTGGVPISRWPWGATGPRALTHFLRQTGEINHALPQSAFYAIPQSDVRRFVTPDALTRADLPPDAWAVHLWARDLRQVLRRDYGGQVPEGSFLARALAGEPL